MLDPTLMPPPPPAGDAELLSKTLQPRDNGHSVTPPHNTVPPRLGTSNAAVPDPRRHRPGDLRRRDGPPVTRPPKSVPRGRR